MKIVSIGIALLIAAHLAVEVHPAPTIEQITLQLHQAVTKSDFEKVVDLINQGADLKMQLGGTTAVGLALDNFFSDRKILKYFIEKGAKKDLLAAVAIGTEPEIKKLAKSKSALNLRTPLGKTPLHLAVHYRRSVTVIDILVNAGADINAVDQFERSALSWSMQNGPDTSVTFRLIEQGADINARDALTQTPLYYAASYGQTEVVKTLINKGVDVTVPGQQGLTPLHMAAQYNRHEIAELLLQNGAKINAQTVRGATPLALARKANLQEMVDLLLKHGAKDEPIPSPAEMPLKPQKLR